MDIDFESYLSLLDNSVYNPIKYENDNIIKTNEKLEANHVNEKSVYLDGLITDDICFTEKSQLVSEFTNNLDNTCGNITNIKYDNEWLDLNSKKDQLRVLDFVNEDLIKYQIYKISEAYSITVKKVSNYNFEKKYNKSFCKKKISKNKRKRLRKLADGGLYYDNKGNFYFSNSKKLSNVSKVQAAVNMFFRTNKYIIHIDRFKRYSYNTVATLVCTEHFKTYVRTLEDIFILKYTCTICEFSGKNNNLKNYIPSKNVIVK